jgi:threonylcarbamoyladenosine tRNA methylthiotransferase MtaB
VCGCYSQYKFEDIKNKNIGIILGTKYKIELNNYIKQYNGTQILKIDNISKEKKIEYSKTQMHEHFSTRGFIKIQDGCNFNCSYCIIPLVRGAQRSLSNEIVVSEINKMLDQNIKEIVLTGVNTSGYNYNGFSFFDLLLQINSLEGDFRVRISSLEPFQIDHKIVDLITKNKHRWCQSFHLCLQNSTDKILKEMNRKYTFLYFNNLVKYIRKKSPFCSITTDYIVGFPSETKDDFAKSIENLKILNFSNIHIFPFSVHKGTPADNIRNLVTDTEKKKRYSIISEINNECSTAYLKKFIGITVNVLFERTDKKNIQQGHSEYFFSVSVLTTKSLQNQMKKVKITSIDDNKLFGKIIDM